MFSFTGKLRSSLCYHFLILTHQLSIHIGCFCSSFDWDSCFCDWTLLGIPCSHVQLDYVNWGGRTHPKYGWNHFKGWIKRRKQMEHRQASFPCPPVGNEMLLTPATMPALQWWTVTLNLKAKANPSFPKLLLSSTCPSYKKSNLIQLLPSL